MKILSPLARLACLAASVATTLILLSAVVSLCDASAAPALLAQQPPASRS